MISVSDIQKMGLGIMAFGVFFLFMGVMLFFDRGLLAMGNILFVLGLSIVNGMTKTATLFFGQKHRLPGTLLFVVGMGLVLYGWCLVGMVVEAAGLFKLFGDSVPVALSYVRRLPILGLLLAYPPIAEILDRLSPQAKSRPQAPPSQSASLR
eukprot:comp19930_c0_seq1/m.24210 comp19930_c0_seq1/g.24210  ORF comp19930_c0_seq1/g.24210 comp19930_c0_seq1/m.24210 type:complete len:152 (-) comp19930_c0_seq1:234-689(-)